MNHSVARRPFWLLAAASVLFNVLSGWPVLATPAETSPPFLGLAFIEPGQAMSARDTGWDSVRIPVSWSDVDSGKDRLKWKRVDSRVEDAVAAGLRIQAVLNLAWPESEKRPYLLDPKSRLPADAEGISAMRRFIVEAVARYRFQAEAFGVEEDLSRDAFPGGPNDYASILRQVSSVVRASAPGKPVVFGAVAFDTMEEDRRVFFLSDVLDALGGAPQVFDAIELRVVGRNPREDYHRIEAAVNHLRGQLEASPYEKTDIALLTSSPDTGGLEGQDAQAADLVRRVLKAGELGVGKVYWDGGLTGRPLPRSRGEWGKFAAVLENAGFLDENSSEKRPYFRKAYYSAQLLSRLQRRFDLRKIRVVPRLKAVFHARVFCSDGEMALVWNDYFTSGKSFGSTTPLELSVFGIEGPKREGLYALETVPGGNGVFPLRRLPYKTFDLNGAPVILSQDKVWLREAAGMPPAPLVYGAGDRGAFE